MTQSNDSHNVISYLTALHDLRETEQQQGIEPLERGDDCPTPHEHMSTIVGQAPPEQIARVENHTAGCKYCSLLQRSLTAFLHDEPLPELPEDEEDPLGRWSEEDERRRRNQNRDLEPDGKSQAKVDRNRAEGSVPGSGWTAFGGTLLAQSTSPAEQATLLDKLKLWLPVLRRDLGLPSFDEEQFFAVVRKHLPLASDQRFRDHLPLWLAEVTGCAADRINITPEVVAAASIGVAVGQPEPGESPLAAEVRAFLLNQHLPHPDAILTVIYPENLRANAALPAYKRDLHRDARRIYREGMELFDFASAA